MPVLFARFFRTDEIRLSSSLSVMSKKYNIVVRSDDDEQKNREAVATASDCIIYLSLSYYNEEPVTTSSTFSATAIALDDAITDYSECNVFLK